MRPPLSKRLEAIRPSLEEAEEVVDQLIKHLEAVKPVLAKHKRWSSG
jgi:hypothetical protein